MSTIDVPKGILGQINIFCTIKNIKVGTFLDYVVEKEGRFEEFRKFIEDAKILKMHK